LLPLAGPPLENNAGQMDFSTMICFAQRIRRTVSEMDYASARLTALRVCGGAGQSGRAPDTYAEFLLRTSLPLPHEPPARGRQAPQ
jgi:hypothetical protein